MNTKSSLALLLFFVTLFFFISPVSAQQQVMVTPDSYVEDKNGNEITYKEFVEQMNTGKFIPAPIQNENGEQIGFRLTPRNSSSVAGEKSPGHEIKLESSKIEESENLQFIYRDYVFAPLEFFNGKSWIKKWMVFDTGTFIPVILLPEVAEEIGPVQKIKIGEIEVFEPPVGSYEFNDLIRNLNRYRDRYPEEFGEYDIAGIAGLPVLSNYLVSIQTQSGQITLRPMDSEQRTLNAKAPIAQVQYTFEQGNIWFPVTINGTEGFAHLDTGNPYFDVDSNIISTKDQTIESYIVGKTDLAEYLNLAEFRSEHLNNRYQGTSIEVISAFGNLAAKPFVITIDPRERTIYFEER